MLEILGDRKIEFLKPDLPDISAEHVDIDSEKTSTKSTSTDWSEEFLAAFAKFAETADETFVEPEDIPAEYDAKRAEFE